jgi:hypothetical protein
MIAAQWYIGLSKETQAETETQKSDDKCLSSTVTAPVPCILNRRFI